MLLTNVYSVWSILQNIIENLIYTIYRVYVYVQAKRALERFFVKCAFLILFDSLVHTADNGDHSYCRSDYLRTTDLCLSPSM